MIEWLAFSKLHFKYYIHMWFLKWNNTSTMTDIFKSTQVTKVTNITNIICFLILLYSLSIFYHCNHQIHFLSWMLNNLHQNFYSHPWLFVFQFFRVFDHLLINHCATGFNLANSNFSNKNKPWKVFTLDKTTYILFFVL